MKAVFHLNESHRIDSALSNIRNILKMEDVLQVILLINGEAINLFKDPDFTIDILSDKFTINACANSMKSNNVQKSELLPDTVVVESGVYTLTMLQNKEGYAYIKP